MSSNGKSLSTWPVLAGLLLLSLGQPGSAQAARGGDLTFGYTWADVAEGVTFDTVNFTASVTRITPTNDVTPMGPFPIDLPSGFEFYGTVYNEIWVSDNGWLSFTDPTAVGAAPIPGPIPDPGGPMAMLAPFWSDLTVAEAGGRISIGSNAAGSIFRIQWIALDEVSGSGINMDLLLFADGRIKIQHRTALPLDTATMGVENEAATDGIQFAAGGVVVPGVDITANYVVEIQPPPVITPLCGSIPNVACGSLTGMSPAPGANIPFYSCSANRYDAQEALYSFTLTEPSEVDLTLTSATGLTLFVLEQCNERSCIDGPGTNLSLLLGAGTYYVCVDGLTPANEGAFDLNIVCTPLGTPITCGMTVMDTTVGGSSYWPIFDCAGLRNSSGPERIYSVDAPVVTNILASLTSVVDLDVYVLFPDSGPITREDCIAWGDMNVAAWDAPPGRFLIVVDGFAGAEGDFTLTVNCGVNMDCSAPLGTADFSLASAHDFSGDTTGLPNTISQYRCEAGTLFDGPDQIIEIILDQPGYVFAFQTSGTPGLQLFLTNGCNEGGCVGGGVLEGQGCGAQLEPGTYYLSVDAMAGVEGPYELTIGHEPTFNRWSECELPSGMTMLSDEQSPFWAFNDGAYCYTERDSINFPDGCIFAMYVTVDCGTAMHLPLYDVEGGHLRVFDVLAGEYVELTAISGGGFFQMGTEIQWQDLDCTGGSDPRWNDVVTDVFFSRPEGLCGVFRLEFIRHSGFEWELFANCDGSRGPNFNISDSLCGALSIYRPLPVLSIELVSEVYNCPDLEVTYRVRNDGCVPVQDVEVTLFDLAVPVASDLIPSLTAGESRVIVMNTPVAFPSGVLTLQVDPNDTILECDEAGDRSACEILNGTDVLGLIGCSLDCTMTTRATATPDKLCSDDVGATVTIDASSTVAVQCVNGVVEYALFDGVSVTPWQVSPIFAGLMPTADTPYTVGARCRDDPACEHFADAPVTVQRRPDLDPASVQARDRTNCNLGVLVTWDAATFFGPSGTGVYNVYRSDVDCVTGLAAVRIGITDTEFIDVPPMADTPYFYVVEAEDDNGDTACLPVGPFLGGSTTRVPANGGVCAAVVDVISPRLDLLPRIGETLRLGGTDPGSGASRYAEWFVQLFWSPDRDVDASSDEHWHVYRSATANGGFVLISTEDPRWYVNEDIDDAADHPDDGTAYVWHYLVFTADACEGENTDHDRFESMP